MSEKYSNKIATDAIKDPRTRWMCQRLDKTYRAFTKLLTEVREMNSILKDIRAMVMQDYRDDDGRFDPSVYNRQENNRNRPRR